MLQRMTPCLRTSLRSSLVNEVKHCLLAQLLGAVFLTQNAVHLICDSVCHGLAVLRSAEHELYGQYYSMPADSCIDYVDSQGFLALGACQLASHLSVWCLVCMFRQLTDNLVQLLTWQYNIKC